MAKRNSPALDYAIYVFVRIMVSVVQAVSWPCALSLAHGAAWLAFKLIRRFQRVARDNLRHAYGIEDETTLDRLVYANYLHWSNVVVEIIRLSRTLHKHNVYEFVNHAGPDDLEVIRRLAKSGPLMVMTGHFGNWEVLSYVTGLVGFRGAIVARRLDNPYLDRYLAKIRRKTGMTLLDKTADFARILDTLAQGRGVGMVGDQDAGPRGLFVDFFGRPASTFKSIALLALEYQTPILVMGAARIGTPMKYVVYLEDVILPQDYAKQADATRLITQRYTEALERMVRRHPEQYLWLHRRWKSQPRQRLAKKAA